jgi:hypothetical protein
LSNYPQLKDEQAKRAHCKTYRPHFEELRHRRQYSLQPSPVPAEIGGQQVHKIRIAPNYFCKSAPLLAVMVHLQMIMRFGRAVKPAHVV